jgi:hypothetical protein
LCGGIADQIDIASGYFGEKFRLEVLSKMLTALVKGSDRRGQ